MIQIRKAICIAYSIFGAIKLSGGIVKALTKGYSIYKRRGTSGLVATFRSFHQKQLISPASGSEPFDRNDYKEWVKRYDTINDKMRDNIYEYIRRMDSHPLISIIMPTYNANKVWLTEAVNSVKNQLYPYWELCISDDASDDKGIIDLLNLFTNQDSRIKLVFRKINGHISKASNSAIAISTGNWISFMDHDDLLPEHALFCIAKEIYLNPKAQIIYTDEDIIDEQSNRIIPHFKSDWNIEILFSHNYITHFTAYHRQLIEKVGRLRSGVEGAQDYDLLLRCIPHIDISKNQIRHIPRILYHWRSHTGSTAGNPEAKKYSVNAGLKSLKDYFATNQLSVEISNANLDNFYRITHYNYLKNKPFVSILIPTRDQSKTTEKCVRSIIEKTKYKNFEIIIIDNESIESETKAFFRSIVEHEPKVKVVEYNKPFNYSAINNFGVNYSKGEIVGLINNDTEVINREWLDEILTHVTKENIGCVGAKLYYPNDTIQHGGVVLGIGGVAGHSHRNSAKQCLGYMNRLNIVQNVSAVTGACLFVRKHVFKEVCGLDEINLKIAFNDVDFCLKVKKAGYKNVWTPFSQLYHYESLSRGYEDNAEKIERFNKEVEFMKKKWGKVLFNDEYYNPNLTLDYEDFSLAWPPRVEPLL